MIRPMSEPDWFIASPDLVSQLENSPGIRFKRGRFEIHRSMLPLLASDLEVSRLLDRTANLAERDARDALTEPLGFKLRRHQHEGVEFIAKRRGCLVADQMRTGKTATAVMAHDPAQGSLVVICPKIVREVWIGWIRRRYPEVEVGRDIAVMEGREFNQEDFKKPFIIGHYDILKYWQAVGGQAKIGTLIYDEAHLLSKENHRTIAANFVAGRAGKVVALTGTPMWNKPAGLWFVLNMIGQESWGSFWNFRMRYCQPEPSMHGMKFIGTSNESELKERLKEVMICRKLSDVMDVPEITRDVLIADITMQQRMDIDVQAEELKAADTLHNAIGALARYRKVIGALKVDVTVEAATTALDREEPVVIWTWHKEVAKAVQLGLRAKKHRAVIIDGDVSDKKREKLLTEWRSAPNTALIISISIGQAGIDLSHARIEFFCEIDFTPAVVAQAEMRIFSSLRPMHASYIVLDHPVDRQIVAAMQGKLDMSDKLKVPAAEAAIDVLAAAFSGGKMPEGDLNRLMMAMLEAGF